MTLECWHEWKYSEEFATFAFVICEVDIDHIADYGTLDVGLFGLRARLTWQL